MKKSILKILIITLMPIISFSCSMSLYEHNENEIQKARSAWIGASKYSLIQSWGEPHSITKDRVQGVVYNYERFNGYITWVTKFYIDEEGVVYDLNAYSK